MENLMFALWLAIMQCISTYLICREQRIDHTVLQISQNSDQCQCPHFSTWDNLPALGLLQWKF